MAAVNLIGVRKAFGRTEVIHGVDLGIADGEFVVFVGPSGCGKSTLLRLIAGLEDATGGDILIGGERVTDLPPARRGIAMVFQSYALYPHMTAYGNMAFGLTLARASKQTVDQRVRRAARILRIEDLLDRRPRDLSGGQRQRVAIGRAIVREPRVFLFDEPLSNLDASLRVQMRLEIATLKAALKATMVYVTHDQVEAMTLADRIVVLNAGRVEQVGPPLELYHRPVNRFVAGFIGSPRMNFLDCEATAAGDAAGVVLRLPGNGTLALPAALARAAPRGPVTLGIRPESLRPGGGPLAGEVFVVEHLGAETHIHVRLPDGQTLVASLPGDPAIGTGGAVSLSPTPGALHLFGRDGRRIDAADSLPNRA